MDKKLMMRISILFLIFTVFWGVVFASFVIYSNTATTQVGAYALTLTSPANAPLYSNITLSATLLKNSAAFSGQTVTFYIDQGAWNSIGSAITDGSGVAEIQYNVTVQGALPFQARYEIV